MLFQIAIKLGIKVIPYTATPEPSLFMKLSKDGFYCRKNGAYWIYYNDEMPYERINYTMAHELAHIILNYSQESELAEAEANFFAKYLLAPPIIIRYFKFENSEIVAKRCHISKAAASHAFDLYRKRCLYGSEFMMPYELKIFNLFNCTTNV